MSIHNSNRIRLGSLHKVVSYSIWLILAITGVVWTWRQDWLMTLPDDFSVNMLKIHGVFAALSLIILGTLISTHMKAAYQRKRNRMTGLILLIMFSIMSASGYALYYSPEAWHELIKWTHVWSGIAVIVLLPAHIFIGRTLQRRRISAHRQVTVSK